MNFTSIVSGKAFSNVIPAPQLVIPAKAGIQNCYMDSRFRGNDKLKTAKFFQSVIFLSLLVIANHCVAEPVAKPSPTTQLTATDKPQTAAKETSHFGKKASELSRFGTANMDNPDAEPIVGRAIKGFLYCLGIFLLGTALVRHYGSSKKAKDAGLIHVLSRSSLSGRAALLLVEVDGQKFLLSQNADDIQLVSAVESQDEALEFGEELVRANANAAQITTELRSSNG